MGDLRSRTRLDGEAAAEQADEADDVAAGTSGVTSRDRPGGDLAAYRQGVGRTTMDPYQAPTSEVGSTSPTLPGDFVLVKRHVTLWSASAEVAVGRTRLTIYFNGWSGLEIYSVDGMEVLRTRSLSFSGRRSLSLPDGKIVELTVKFLPLWTGRLVIDGQVVVENLFPHYRWWQIAPLLIAGACAVFLLVMYYQIGPGSRVAPPNQPLQQTVAPPGHRVELRR